MSIKLIKETITMMSLFKIFASYIDGNSSDYDDGYSAALKTLKEEIDNDFPKVREYQKFKEK